MKTQTDWAMKTQTGWGHEDISVTEPYPTTQVVLKFYGICKPSTIAKFARKQFYCK